MKKIAAALLAGFAVLANANAEDRILGKGDFVELIDEKPFTVSTLRKALSEIGYYGFYKGDHAGRTIRMTAYASNDKRYRMQIHNRTGEVIRIGQVKQSF